MREALAPYEGELVVVRGTLKESRNGPDKHWNLLFVNCVFKPVGEPDTPLSEVEAGRTDHAWVRVDELTLQLWKGQNADGLLLKKLENVFLVERYRRKDGTQDFGLALSGEQWLLASSTLGHLKQLKRHSTGLTARGAIDLLEMVEHVTSKFPHFSSIDSKISVKRILSQTASMYSAYKAALLHREAREAGMRKKTRGGQKRGTKPGRGF